MEERGRLPEGMLEEIVEAGAYERAYAVYQRDPKARSGLIDDVIAMEFELVQQELDARKAKTGPEAK